MYRKGEFLHHCFSKLGFTGLNKLLCGLTNEFVKQFLRNKTKSQRDEWGRKLQFPGGDEGGLGGEAES